MNWIDQLKNKFNTANIVEQIIFINIAVFVLTYLFNTLSFLFGISSNFIIDWFALSPNLNNLLYKPWTLFSYGFLHSGLLHILFNLIFLFYIGNLFLDFFNKKQFIAYYILGIFFGGIIYLFSYNYLPALNHQNTILVGASAGVMAILVGLASYVPNFALHFRFIGNIKLLYIAIGFVALDIIQIPVENAGGHLAHLGGAIIGFLLTKYFQNGKPIIAFWEGLFQPKKQKPLKTVYKTKSATKKRKDNTTNQQQKIDQILDKISKSGYETLSKEEKDFLFRAGKNN